jgi:hypothetical protein
MPIKKKTMDQKRSQKRKKSEGMELWVRVSFVQHTREALSLSARTTKSNINDWRQMKIEKH